MRQDIGVFISHFLKETKIKKGGSKILIRVYPKSSGIEKENHNEQR